MNILVIGNGFDLAHGLPTKYTDFLYFCSIVNCLIKYNKIENKIPKCDDDYIKWVNNDESVDVKKIDLEKNMLYWYERKAKATERDKKVYKDIFENFITKTFLEVNKNQKIVKEIIYLIFNNFWIDFFIQHDMHCKENWIDFEFEISNIIRTIEKIMRKKSSIYDEVTDWSKWPFDFLKKYYVNNENDKVEFKEIRDKMQKDLNKLIRVFEIYLTIYVEKITIDLISPDIECVAAVNIYGEHGIKGILLSQIISFNYTKIFWDIYMDKFNIASEKYIDYIHGKADIENNLKTNNMVLGMDEYLSEKRKNRETEFIAFKKYYQRIHKETGCKYKEWVNKIKESGKEVETNFRKEFPMQIPIEKFRNCRHNLYIFGHSLDVTDKDILKELILNDNVKTTIFYLNKDIMGQQIANLVKIIGQDELIRRTGGRTKTIEFKQQRDMIPINTND